MLTLNALGKHGGDLIKFLRSELKDNENELKILIDGPIQVEEIRKFLEPLGFSDFILEDDDGNLYLMTSKKVEIVEDEAPPAPPPAPVAVVPQVEKSEKISLAKEKENTIKNINIKNSTGILISCGTGKYKNIFMKKILASIINSKIKPNVIALMNGAVNLAAYNSVTCDYLKKLEADEVKILISESCADYMGISEAIGAGTLVDMSEIFEEIFSCEKVISL